MRLGLALWPSRSLYLSSVDDRYGVLLIGFAPLPSGTSNLEASRWPTMTLRRSG